MKIAIPIFDRVTALDAIGPYEVLSRLPGAELKFVGFEPGPVKTDNRMLSLNIETALDDFAEPDILVFPGGFGTRALMKDERMLEWVRHVHEGTQWTTSVCTGSLVLGAAGLLDGLEATTHWAAMATLERLGAKPTGRRVVEQGKIVTAAGVSSGIDMALRLAGHVAGDTVAQAIQLGIEYDPQPPYDSGSPEKASPEVLALVKRAESDEAQAAAA
ncbi:MAG TPA: DJ-1/PfpI family protein [Thermoleophilaceae bacterium]|nr:DJ-1/PfpI family protein [Thermoleophilaceae bacterium]